jgi:Tfp pilus assembly protein PilF
VKKIIINIVVFVFAFCANAQASSTSSPQASPSDEAEALFAQGEYLKGRDILTKALNDPDPMQRAYALQAYARFYENIAGNIDNALTFYGDILRTNLPVDHPMKLSAQKEIGRLKQLKIEYKAEDALLRKLQLSETVSPDENRKRITQLLAIIEQKPDYYRLSEVYYQLGRNYFATVDYYNAYISSKKAMELKPGVNFYLPVNVWMDAAYSKWVRANIHTALWGTIGGLLVLTVIVFYACRPWRWLKFRHLIIGFSMVLLWLIVFSVSYKWFAGKPGVSETTMFEAGVVPPYFFSFGPDGPYWKVTQSLFVYGLVGVLGVFVFSIGIGRLKYRWAALLINLVFAVLLFTSLTMVFYMRNCDQKSMFGSEGAGSVWHYLKGDNYFVSFGMEPYVLTNPKAFPNLALNNLSDPYMLEWVKKYCPFPPPSDKPAP